MMERSASQRTERTDSTPSMRLGLDLSIVVGLMWGLKQYNRGVGYIMLHTFQELRGDRINCSKSLMILRREKAHNCQVSPSCPITCRRLEHRSYSCAFDKDLKNC